MSETERARLAEFFAGIGLFQGLPARALARLAEASDLLRPADGTQLFAAGDPADALYAVLPGDGRVRAGAMDARGKKLLVEVFGAGEVFGEIAVLEKLTRTADAVTEGRVRLARIRGPEFLHLLGSEPALGLALSRSLAARLRRTFTLLQDATFESLEVRLARQLIYLAKQGGEATGDGLRIAGRFRQGDLADLMGATTRSIITILNAWRAAGIVAYDTDRAFLTIRDRERLSALIGGG